MRVRRADRKPSVLLLKSVGVFVLAAGLVYALGILHAWVGDWAALLWVCGTLFFPWTAGVALGSRIGEKAGWTVGGAIGAAAALGPLALFAGTALEGPPAADLRLLSLIFTPVAAVNGAMGFPVGANVRGRDRGQ